MFPFKKSKSRKYDNIWTEYNGKKYQSKAEARRAEELDTMLKHGVILSWTPQPKYTLGCPENVYRADFEVRYADGTIEAQDVKGMRTPVFNHHVKLWRAYGPHTLAIITARPKGWRVEYVRGGADTEKPNDYVPMPREQGFKLAEKKKRKTRKVTPNQGEVS